MATAPTITITMEITIATMGRSIKNLEIIDFLPVAASSTVAFTCMPSRTFEVPSETTSSPGAKPSSMIHKSPTRSPTFTLRTEMVFCAVTDGHFVGSL